MKITKKESTHIEISADQVREIIQTYLHEHDIEVKTKDIQFEISIKNDNSERDEYYLTRAFCNITVEKL